MEMEDDDDDGRMFPGPGQPLFASASAMSSRPATTCLFPSAQAHDDDSIHDSAGDGEGEGSNKDGEDDLSTLQLDLAPSTLDAILAAQKRHTCIETTDKKVQSRANDRNIGEAVQVSNKRKQETAVRNRTQRLSWLKGSSDDSEDEMSSRKKKKRKKESHKKKKKEKKHKKHSRRLSRSPSPPKCDLTELPFIPKGKIFLEDIPNLKPEHAFRLDRKANTDLWLYKSVSKQHLPKYKDLCFNCLGNSNVSMKGKKQSKKDNLKQSRYYRKDWRRLIRRPGSLVSSDQATCDDKQSRSYIPLPKVSKEETSLKKDLGSYSCLDEATRMYSQGKGGEYSKPPDRDEEQTFHMDEIFRKVASFNQKIREDPSNVQLWLDFVSFQDIVAHEDKTFKGETIRLREVYQPSKSVIEKKLSILEKALKENPSSLQLKLAQLELYEDVWESEKLEKVWENLLFVHSSNVDVWRQYLSRQQTSLSKFTFSRVVKLYHKCFKTLVPILDGSVRVVNKPSDLEEKILDLFSQYCDYLSQCGYCERAVGSFQALVELNLYCPPSLNLAPTQHRLASFEQFWETGLAKFGEPGAKGWAHWMDRKDSALTTPSIPVSTEDQEDSIVSEKLSQAQTWLQLERLRQASFLLPWRPDVANGESEESLEDLDRLVLIDDISPTLFTFHKSDSCTKVLHLFLKFLGLNSSDLENVFGESSSPQSEFLQYSLVSLVQCPEAALLNPGVGTDNSWKPGGHLVSFIRNILQQAESYFGVTNRTLFTQIRLELEVKKSGVLKASELQKQDAKEIKKFGKSLLKENQNRNNLFVWDAFIRLQWACSDKMAETVSMIEVALGMFMGSSAPTDTDRESGLCCLCRTYSQILLNFEPLEHVTVRGKHSAPTSEDKLQVMACLGNLIEKKPFKSNKNPEISPSFILRIQRRFQKRLSDLNSSFFNSAIDADHSSIHLITILTECYAIFQYCISNLKTANSVYTSAKDLVKSQVQLDSESHPALPSLLLSLNVSNIALVTNVMHVESVPLTLARGLVENALKEFPESSQLHAALIRLESGSYIAGRLRKYYEGRLRKPSSVLAPLFAVTSELLRHRSLSEEGTVGGTGLCDPGTVHRVRSVFEQALQRPACRHCPLLWRLYLYFESQNGSLSRSKGILYRGLQSCPWVKELYLDGTAIFGDAELQEMTDLLTEKEIRVCMPPEEADLLINAIKEEVGEDVQEEESEDELRRGEEEIGLLRQQVKQEFKVEDDDGS